MYLLTYLRPMYHSRNGLVSFGIPIAGVILSTRGRQSILLDFTNSQTAISKFSSRCQPKKMTNVHWRNTAAAADRLVRDLLAIRKDLILHTVNKECGFILIYLALWCLVSRFIDNVLLLYRQELPDNRIRGGGGSTK